MKHLVLVTCAALLSAGCSDSVDPYGEHVERECEPFRSLGGGDEHEDITARGLSFLSADMREQLAEKNEDVDDLLDIRHDDSKYHVDNCRIEESFDSIRQRYGSVVAGVSPNPALQVIFLAIHEFGSILHTIQDFYSHSNWVEGGQTGLFSENAFQFPSVKTGQMLGGMMVLTESLPFSFTIDLPPNSRVPLVQLAGSTRIDKGLITGVHGNDDPSICPLEASIPHGALVNPSGLYLSKDDPDSPNHRQAVDLAIRQTTEEFCRLGRLVSLRHGDPGLNAMLSAFEANRAGYEAACPRNRGLVASVFMAAL